MYTQHTRNTLGEEQSFGTPTLLQWIIVDDDDDDEDGDGVDDEQSPSC